MRNSGIENSFHVLIFNFENKNILSNGSQICLLANIIQEYFNATITIEISDQNELKFLSYKPKKICKNMGPQYHPQYLSGNIFINNMMESLNVTVHFNSTLLSFLENCLISKKNEQSNSMIYHKYQ